MTADPKYPDNYSTHMLNVRDDHTLYVEESGNPAGIPVIKIHGGPGSQCKPKHRALFDLAKYRVILYDQRGCGQSQYSTDKPNGLLKENTTQHLIADLEAIRTHLGIDRWIVTGSSWGSTLSLLYAQAYPARVRALVVSGIFLARHYDVAWIYSEVGPAAFFPEAYRAYLTALGVSDPQQLQKTQQQRILAGDTGAALARLAYLGSFFDMATNIEPLPNMTPEQHAAFVQEVLREMQIELHYEQHGFFIDENQILANMAQISHIPGTILHGRYDMLCPPTSAYQLHQAWSNSKLLIVADGGHSTSATSYNNTLKNVLASLEIV